jgi:hypothetical protein
MHILAKEKMIADCFAPGRSERVVDSGIYPTSPGIIAKHILTSIP